MCQSSFRAWSVYMQDIINFLQSLAIYMINNECRSNFTKPTRKTYEWCGNWTCTCNFNLGQSYDTLVTTASLIRNSVVSHLRHTNPSAFCVILWKQHRNYFLSVSIKRQRAPIYVFPRHKRVETFSGELLPFRWFVFKISSTRRKTQFQATSGRKYESVL